MFTNSYTLQPNIKENCQMLSCYERTADIFDIGKQYSVEFIVIGNEYFNILQAVKHAGFTTHFIKNKQFIFHTNMREFWHNSIDKTFSFKLWLNEVQVRCIKDKKLILSTHELNNKFLPFYEIQIIDR